MKFSMLLLTICVVLFCVSVLSDQNNQTLLLKQWQALDNNTLKMTTKVVNMLLPQMMEFPGKLNVSFKCLQQVMHLISGIRQLNLEAIKFIDSSTKAIDGLFRETISSPGVYNECLDSVVTSKKTNKSLFSGKYCQLGIRPPLPLKSKNYKHMERIKELTNFTGSEMFISIANLSGNFYSYPLLIGLCVPSGCNVTDIVEFTKSMDNHFSTTVNFCQVKEKIRFSTLHISAIVVCCLFLLLVITGTSLELFFKQAKRNQKCIVYHLLISFSFVSNLKKLFSAKSPASDLRCFHGLKFLSLNMAVFSHSYSYAFLMKHMYGSLSNALDMMKTPMGHVILNSYLVLDTFFFISGFFVCYIVLKEVKINKIAFNTKMFILHRYWRLAPVYYFVILVSMLTPLMGSGPNFKTAMNFSVENCHKNWWFNLLFINNFLKVEDMCMIHTWFIACMFQLYVSSLLVLIPLMRSEFSGVCISTAIIIASVLYSGLITYYNDIMQGFDLKYADKGFMTEYFLKVYANPLTHAGPYYIGMLSGYLLIKKPDLKISKKCQVMGWFLSAILIGYTMIWPAMWEHYSVTLLETCIHAGLQRCLWIISVSWITISCCTGHGGFVNTFLSWGLWTQLSKLTYLIYLIQPTLQTMYLATLQSLRDFSHFELVTIYFGQLVMAGLLAILCNLLIESPLLNIEKLFVKKGQSKENHFMENGQKTPN